jgi:hypothetical protein
VNAGVPGDDRRHRVVVADRMQPNPWLEDAASWRGAVGVPVEGLMLMPENRQVQLDDTR